MKNNNTISKLLKEYSCSAGMVVGFFIGAALFLGLTPLTWKTELVVVVAHIALFTFLTFIWKEDDKKWRFYLVLMVVALGVIIGYYRPEPFVQKNQYRNEAVYATQTQIRVDAIKATLLDEIMDSGNPMMFQAINIFEKSASMHNDVQSLTQSDSLQVKQVRENLKAIHTVGDMIVNYVEWMEYPERDTKDEAQKLQVLLNEIEQYLKEK